MKKIFLTILVVVFFGIIFFTLLLDRSDVDKNLQTESILIDKDKEIVIYESENSDSAEINSTVETVVSDEVIANVLPENISIDVPFTSQAPFGVWDERHEEACEEASLLMIVKYLSGENLTPKTSEKDLQSMIDFQIENYGDYKDSDMEGVVQLAKDFYELNNLEVIYDFKKNAIKEELAKGNPIIVPTAGRLLENPYFTPPGPLYHNLVLIGYDGDNIMTNDPGTKRGEGYVYDIDTLYDAIHDFTGKKENIEKGRKAMIVIK